MYEAGQIGTYFFLRILRAAEWRFLGKSVQAVAGAGPMCQLVENRA